ncbi:MAG: threonine--tRNA ligase, partial [Rickettsiales bacterium]|nr:threonine--tRNA ligase [Rickettsiales bacterium]
MAYDIEVIRHSLAHVLAAAVQKIWPDVKFGGGPAIENGFYYDFDLEHKISEDDFPRIEKEMRELIKSNGRFERREISVDEAREIFRDQPYKLEWLADLESPVTIYTFRDFTDLCRSEEHTSELQSRC